MLVMPIHQNMCKNVNRVREVKPTIVYCFLFAFVENCDTVMCIKTELSCVSFPSQQFPSKIPSVFRVLPLYFGTFCSFFPSFICCFICWTTDGIFFLLFFFSRWFYFVLLSFCKCKYVSKQFLTATTTSTNAFFVKFA